MAHLVDEGLHEVAAGATSDDDTLPGLGGELNAAFPGLELPDRLKRLRSRIGGRIVFTTSFGLEDQALTHLLAQSGIDVEYATLDTGRLFPETYALWAQTEARYDIRIRAFYPDHKEIEALVRAQGINGLYRSMDARKACCEVRKIRPLERALRGTAAWITGLRADQSTARQDVAFVAYDATRGLLKANPLADWTRERVIALAENAKVPCNPLHAQGFLSIGCAPCTRAVLPGEPERSGRWWWETESAKECGLHVSPDGHLVRAKSSNDADLPGSRES
ncbi:MAG: phosphoadenylyl-sulfate reductase [Acetobacteraceae bacterium]